MTPALRYLCTSDTTLPSFTVSERIWMSLGWQTVSKNLSRSMSTTHM